MVEVREAVLSLPEQVVESVTRIAAEEKRPVGEVLGELVARYETSKALRELMKYGRETGRASGYKEEDVVGLVKEIRRERAAERTGNP